MTDSPIDSRLQSLPVDFFGDALRALADDSEALAAFANLIDQATYDPERPLDRGTFSFMVLAAIDECQVHDSDPAAVLRAMTDGLRLHAAGAGSPVPMRDRLRALRHPEEDR
jgi:hypothetical protein